MLAILSCYLRSYSYICNYRVIAKKEETEHELATINLLML